MHLRPAPVETLVELAGSMPVPPSYWGGFSDAVAVNLEDAEPTIRFGGHEVPATPTGLDALGTYYEVPVKFLGRIEPDEKQYVLSRRIERSEEKGVQIRFSSDGLVEMLPASAVRLDPSEIITAMMRVMPEDSLVVEWTSNNDTLLLDTIVPESAAMHIGGDRKVGDITRGGLRVGQDRKRNLAPWVQPFLYRLACTNGMEVPDTSLKVDARGSDGEEILRSLSYEARSALDGVGASIEAFYDLRHQNVGGDKTGVLHRILTEHDLPARAVTDLEDALPGYLMADFNIGSGDEVTMFHLVNLVTNMANHPSLAGHPSSRRRLERIGGGILNDHAARCSFCASRLS